jgi:hypothetical protein
MQLERNSQMLENQSISVTNTIKKELQLVSRLFCSIENLFNWQHKYYGTIIQKYRYRVSPNFGSKSIGDTTIDTTFENYRRYFDRYRKSIGDTADTDTLSPILTTLIAAERNMTTADTTATKHQPLTCSTPSSSLADGTRFNWLTCFWQTNCVDVTSFIEIQSHRQPQ